jgi:ABC-type glucose/galactose transport system permease subunit
MISIVFTLLKEILLSMIGKIAFKSIAERLATRLVVYGLNKLKKQTTNTVVQSTVDDVLAQLSGKKLKVIDG